MAVLAEVCVTHPFGVGLEVAQRLVDRLGRRVGEGQALGGGHERGNVTAVEVGEPVGEPAVGVLAQGWGGQGCEGV